MERIKLIMYCDNCETKYQNQCAFSDNENENKYGVLKATADLREAIKKCQCKLKNITIGHVKVKLKGKPFVIGVDTFDGNDWFVGYFDTNEEAVSNAQSRGREMEKYHAYDKYGRHIGEGGTF